MNDIIEVKVELELAEEEDNIQLRFNEMLNNTELDEIYDDANILSFEKVKKRGRCNIIDDYEKTSKRIRYENQ